MTPKNRNTEFLWDKVVEDLDNEDIVVEIRISETSINDYNNLLIDISSSDFDYVFSYLAKIRPIPKSISDNFFQDDAVKQLDIHLNNKLTVSSGFNYVDEIEFFTNSVINLNSQDVDELFDFIEYLGSVLKKNILLFVEAYPRPTIKYDFKAQKYSVNSGVSLT